MTTGFIVCSALAELMPAAAMPTSAVPSTTVPSTTISTATVPTARFKSIVSLSRYKRYCGSDSKKQSVLDHL
ncbi:hypothetical protein BX070DRAFT_220389 [Coemansia spiralis]|nr:hypothetical protein BX070DRAFT_220389 [Coemansia spiralis]